MLQGQCGQPGQTCQEVDEVLEVLHDSRAEGHAAQGDCLVLNHLPAAFWAPEGRIRDCICIQWTSAAYLLSFPNSN